MQTSAIPKPPPKTAFQNLSRKVPLARFKNLPPLTINKEDTLNSSITQPATPSNIPSKSQSKLMKMIISYKQSVNQSNAKNVTPSKNPIIVSSNSQCVNDEKENISSSNALPVILSKKHIVASSIVKPAISLK